MAVPEMYGGIHRSVEYSLPYNSIFQVEIALTERFILSVTPMAVTPTVLS